MLSTLDAPFTSHIMSTLLYKIIKLSKECLDSHIINIKYSQGNESKVINIPNLAYYIYIKYFYKIIIIYCNQIIG